MKKQLKNKKGAIGLIIFFLVLFSIVILGFVAAMVVGVLDFASDTITPVMEDLGMAGATNVSEAAGYSFGVLDTFIQALPWLVALSYVLAMVFTLVFVYVVGYHPHPAFMAFYIALMILLIFGCVIMSNMYQDIYSGDDEIATRLQDQTLLSYMLLYSPFIMVVISMVGGVLMFTRMSSGSGSGGFGV